jgi:hypothetical protein
MNSRIALVLLAGLSCVLLVGCDAGPPPAPVFTAAPEVSGNPNPQVPLAAIVSATTDVPGTLEVRISEGDRTWTAPQAAAAATSHRVNILGLKPGRPHALQVTAVDQAGNRSAAVPLKFTPPPLPDDFPAIEVRASDPDRMEPGVTLFALMRWPDGADVDEESGLAIAVDQAGEIVWFRRSEPLWEDPHRIASGHLLGIVGYNRAEEVDMLGNVVTSWHASEHPNPEANEDIPAGSIPVATETFHHDIQELPSGNLLVLSTEVRSYDGYPTSLEDEEAETGTANVVGDVIVEFARDGAIVNEWKLLDMLDPYRLGHESLGGIWDDWAYVDVEGGTKDWAHANSLWYDSATDSIVVSVRHQEAVIGFSRATGTLNWILGNHEGWGDEWAPYLLQAEGDLEWPYHQHAAEITDWGTLIIYDNGNNRTMPPAAGMMPQESYSRAVEYVIDSNQRSVEQVWEYGPDQERFFSPFISEADRLPSTGNVLITDGGRVQDEEGLQSSQIVGGDHWARILEVTRTETPSKVFEIVIDSSQEEPDIGWAVYRAERLPGLYPDQAR